MEQKKFAPSKNCKSSKRHAIFPTDLDKIIPKKDKKNDNETEKFVQPH